MLGMTPRPVIPLRVGCRLAVPAVLALTLLGGCARPPLATLEAAAFPFSVDTLRTRQLGDGAVHHYLYSRQGPWAVHVLDVRLDRCVRPVAVKGGPGAVGRVPTSRLLRDLARTKPVIGGVNADFFLFTPPGVPTGAHVSGGRVITPPGRQPVFAMDSAGIPHIVVLARAGTDSLAIDDPALATLSLRPFHPLEAVGGRPVLVRDSVVASEVAHGTAAFVTARHPRTAVGIARRGTRLVLVTVDGRQAPYSDGMSLAELARLMLALGTPQALNLDGGGSTTLVYADPDSGGALRVANRPSDAGGERAVGNALALVRDCAGVRRH
jgi:exopolysaccharide biosynthesis protein